MQSPDINNIRSRAKGFTLIELLMVVAIIGILAAVAIPSYRNNLLVSRRAEAKSVLLQVASDQERFYSSNNTYSTNALPLAAPPVATRASDNNFYIVTVAACGAGIATCFTATATPQGDQVADACTTLTLNSLGARGATGASVEECWQR
ncbi:MAG: type IV pilin protein [Pseudohongiellaceae bacterium]